MEPFTNDLLTILALISISWAGITFIAVIIISIIFIYLRCKKRRRSIFIEPTRAQSTTSSVIIDHRPQSVSPISIKHSPRHSDHSKKSKIHRHRQDVMTPIDERHYPSHNTNTRYPHNDYIHDEYGNETTRTIESVTHRPYPQQKQYPLIKPVTDVRVIDRNTPYPPDIMARAKRMDANRFPMDDNY
ncbi:hypothetical protein I4U23_019166 [Adineta vaga]|nr:hypothetical protein I4U23_019166 [Adineta vaga]